MWFINSVIHFFISFVLLGNLTPILLDVEDAKLLLKALLCIYPCLIIYDIKKNVAKADKILTDVTLEMQEMGFDIEKQNLLDASVEVVSKSQESTGKKFSDVSVTCSQEKIIKLMDRKSRLLILREVTKSVQSFAYIDPIPESIVHIIDEDEYARILEKKNI